MSMQIYASTTFLGDARTLLAEPLAMLAEVDVDGVELGSTHVWEHDLAQQIDRIWMKPKLTHNYFPAARNDLVLNIASTNGEVRSQSIAHMRDCLRFAAEIGASLYTIHPGFLADALISNANMAEKSYDFTFADHSAPYEQAFALMVEALEELVEVARQNGVRLAIETEGSLTSSGVTLMEKPDEYDRLFDLIPEGLYINFNAAHTSLVAQKYGFDVPAFLARFRHRIAAVEMSHNDGYRDQHLPLVPGAPVLNLLPHLPDVPMILEFRCATVQDISDSVALLRNHEATMAQDTKEQ